MPSATVAARGRSPSPPASPGASSVRPAFGGTGRGSARSGIGSERKVSSDPCHRRPQRRAPPRVAKRGLAAGAKRRRSPRSRPHARGRHRRRLLRDLRARRRLRNRSARSRRGDGRRLGGPVLRAARRRPRVVGRQRGRCDCTARPDDRPDDRGPRAVPRRRRAGRDPPLRGRGADRARSRQSRRVDRARRALARNRLEPSERIRLRRAVPLSRHARRRPGSHRCGPRARARRATSAV